MNAPTPTVKRALLRDMMRIRMVELEIARLYGEQEMRCPTHLCVGQEAPPVGVSRHLRRGDLVFSAHRSHGHYLARGGDLKAMMAELYGRQTGCASGKGGSQNLVDLAVGFMGSVPILASTISVAVGAALGTTMRGEDRIVVSYFGDAAVEEGIFHETMNYASVEKLPVLFVCENNLYGVQSALDVRQFAGRRIVDIAAAHAVPATSGDGNDIDEVWRLAGAAIAAIRGGGWPAMLELATYRWLEHCGPNDDTAIGYRSAAELESWRDRCPVARCRDALLAEGGLTKADFAAMERDIAAEMDAAVAFARNSPFPPPDALASHVFPG